MTAAQICTRAMQIAKCPGYTTQAGQSLNAILQELAQTYDFDTTMLVASGTFNLSQVSGPGNQYIAGCGPNPMPSNYLRAKNNEVIYYIQGVRYVMINLDESEFDMLVQTAGYNSYPTNFYVDMSPKGTGGVPNMYVWPPASGAYPWTVKYFPQMADIATPETSTTVPWFPLQTYLITRLAGELMRDTDDDRAARYLGDSTEGGFLGAAALLNRYLKMKASLEGAVPWAADPNSPSPARECSMMLSSNGFLYFGMGERYNTAPPPTYIMPSDIWRRPVGGSTWEQRANNLRARRSFTYFDWNGTIVIGCGRDDTAYPVVSDLNDFIASTDGGLSFQSLGNASFRGAYGRRATPFNGGIVLTGGAYGPDGTTMDTAYLNEVWFSTTPLDPSSWVAKASLPISCVHHIAGVLPINGVPTLAIISGYNTVDRPDGSPYGTIYTTTDLINWQARKDSDFWVG